MILIIFRKYNKDYPDLLNENINKLVKINQIESTNFHEIVKRSKKFLLSLKMINIKKNKRIDRNIEIIILLSKENIKIINLIFIQMNQHNYHTGSDENKNLKKKL